MRNWVLFGVLVNVGLIFLTCDAFPSNEGMVTSNFKLFLFA